VVTLMDRSNVSTVLCAGQIKKWRGAIVGHDIPKLRAELEASRDHVFAAAGVERDLFRA
jgi:5-methylthioadenosine/S-adenosylhomocysteine deaminase